MIYHDDDAFCPKKQKTIPSLPPNIAYEQTAQNLKNIKEFLELQQYLDSTIPGSLAGYLENVSQYERNAELSEDTSKLGAPWSSNCIHGEVSSRSAIYHVCHNLTRTEIFHVNETDVVSDEGFEMTLSMNQSTLVNEVWHYILARIQQSFGNLINEYIQISRANSIELHSKWFGFSQFVREVAIACSVPVQYILENYRDLVDEKYEYVDEMEVLGLIFADITIKTLGDDTPSFFTRILDTLGYELLEKREQSGQFVILLTSIKTEYNLPELFKTKVVNDLSAYCDSEFEPDWNKNFIEKVQHSRRLACYIVGVCPEDQNRELLQHLIFEVSLLDTCFEYFYSNSQCDLKMEKWQSNYRWPGVPHKCVSPDKNRLWDVIAFFLQCLDYTGLAYSHIDSWITKTISQKLDESYTNLGGEGLIFECCKLHYFFPGDKNLTHMLDMMRPAVGNDEEFFGYFLTISSTCISRLCKNVAFARSSASSTFNGSWCAIFGDNTDTTVMMRNLLYSPILQDMFFKVFSSINFGQMGDKSLMRSIETQLLRNGQNFLSLISVNDNFVFNLMERLYNFYPETHGFKKALREVARVNLLATVDPQVRTESVMDFSMIFLDRNIFGNLVPIGDDDEDITLPNKLKEQWRILHDFYTVRNQAGQLKNIKPAYYLQRCEVTCPFSVNGDKPGTYNFDITVYQACVLGQFNKVDEMNFTELCRVTNIPQHILQSILKSFVAAGLMIKKGSSVRLNDQYEPDMSKIKGDTIYIPMGKITTRKSSVTNSSSTSRTSSNSAKHSEGLASQWKSELLKAAIIRILKGANETYDHARLYQAVQGQIVGTSVGEFAEALVILLRNKDIVQEQELYRYCLD